MCGIAGLYNLQHKPIPHDNLGKMCDAIAHRGPDDEGYVYMDGYIGIGHRRLAIIDLTDAGHQPMMSRNANIWVSYNGEIYNFKELHKELLNGLL